MAVLSYCSVQFQELSSSASAAASFVITVFSYIRLNSIRYEQTVIKFRNCSFQENHYESNFVIV